MPITSACSCATGGRYRCYDGLHQTCLNHLLQLQARELRDRCNAGALGSMFVRPPGGCLANARRRACAVDLERREHSRARPAVTAIWTLYEALFLATADQARVDAADGRTGWLRWTVSRIGPDAVKRLSSPTRT